jgi:HD-like signal output (HDOD) protein
MIGARDVVVLPDLAYRHDPASAHRKALAVVEKLPVFSPVVSRLVASLGDDSVSFAEIASLIERDTVLAGQLLRLVNSAVYSRGREISSVRRAVSILGIAKLRNFAVSFLVAKMWTRVKVAASFSAARFNLHGVATAIMADLLAQKIPVPYGEGAFSAGLLHDVGKLLVAAALPNEYELLIQSQEWDPAQETQRLGVSHGELSREILDRWRLPQPICDAAARHHAPGDGALSLAHLVCAANQFTNALGISIQPREADPGAKPFEALGFGADESADLSQRFDVEFEAVRQFL